VHMLVIVCSTFVVSECGFFPDCLRLVQDMFGDGGGQTHLGATNHTSCPLVEVFLGL
jgi:hypothetical protein